ncbi:PLP-dependent aminotransferase family protein [Actinospica robiniae]|uniref:MocR-like pyridoxine biosynthesis transcription factor PdxR n=1 Tax=Actinospica robiniae TaxID=304901 RepID=UPI00040DD9A5|nr:PLP-dependent aminotransferase family protein [Actinospica robiniae]
MRKDWSTSTGSGVDLHLDLAAGEGRRDGLERALRSAIRSGRLAAGSRLPATRVLAAELGLSRGTVSAAYDQLVAEGYLLARHGSGTTVAHVPDAGTRRSARSVAPLPHDLVPGTPDVTAFPVEVWLRAARRALNAAPSSAFGYAGDLRGRPELRASLADYLGRARGVAASPERIVVVGGYVQGLSLLARALGPGAFGMEDPCLPFHREIVTNASREIVALPVDGDGADVSGLGSGRRSPNCAAVVVTPAHQYPSGVTLAPARRRLLIEWARSSGGVVIEDDYDGEFRYGRQPVGALQGMDHEHVVYAGTCAKALAPALRLGWLVLPATLVDPVIEQLRLTTLQVEAPGQLTLAELINSHAYDRQIRLGRARYRRRRDALIEGLARLPRLGAAGISAGQHVLVRLPQDGPGEADVIEAARRRGLALSGLAEHWHAGHAATRPADGSQGLVVGYGTGSESAYRAALVVFFDVLADLYGGFETATSSLASVS